MRFCSWFRLGFQVLRVVVWRFCDVGVLVSGLGGQFVFKVNIQDLRMLIGFE